MNSERTIVLAMVVTTIVTGAGRISQGKTPTIRAVVGSWTVGFMLLVLANWAPKPATAFATLVMVTALFVDGGAAWGAAGQVTKTGKTAGPSAPTTTPASGVGPVPASNTGGTNPPLTTTRTQ